VNPAFGQIDALLNAPLKVFEKVQNKVENSDLFKDTLKSVDKLVMGQFEEITLEDEAQYGELIATKLKSKIIEDTHNLQYLDSIMKELVRDSKTRVIKYNIKILDDSQINALCAPGGTIYVYSGLIEFLKEKPDAIKFILAHEFAHSELFHLKNQIKIGLAAKKLTGSEDMMYISNVLFNIVTTPYSRQNENEADAEACKICKKMNIPVEDQTFFLKKINDHVNNIKNKNYPDGVKSLEKIFMMYLNTHPDNELRIQNIEKLNE
jgi:Zn-dependent protease with chaperone function